MSYLDYFSNEFDNIDSATYLHDYQKKAIIEHPDYNYEYDRFPKNFKYTKNFIGVPTNPNASKLDKFYTESYLTNKVRNIENIYLGSKEAPEEVSREILPQKQSYLVPQRCSCSKCQDKIIKEYIDRQNVNNAIEELQKRNEMLTIMLIFIVIYCVVQLFIRPHSYIIETIPASTTESQTTAPAASVV